MPPLRPPPPSASSVPAAEALTCRLPGVTNQYHTEDRGAPDVLKRKHAFPDMTGRSSIPDLPLMCRGPYQPGMTDSFHFCSTVPSDPV